MSNESISKDVNEYQTTYYGAGIHKVLAEKDRKNADKTTVNIRHFREL